MGTLLIETVTKFQFTFGELAGMGVMFLCILLGISVLYNGWPTFGKRK